MEKQKEDLQLDLDWIKRNYHWIVIGLVLLMLIIFLTSVMQYNEFAQLAVSDPCGACEKFTGGICLNGTL